MAQKNYPVELCDVEFGVRSWGYGIRCDSAATRALGAPMHAPFRRRVYFDDAGPEATSASGR